VFIIFGIKRDLHRLAAILATCGTCAGTAAQDLFRVRNFFRLFFVPVVPLPTTFRTTCATCGTSTSVSTEQADRLLASAPHVDPPPVTDLELAGSSAAAA
jgi:hypothetical protein